VFQLLAVFLNVRDLYKNKQIKFYVLLCVYSFIRYSVCRIVSFSDADQFLQKVSTLQRRANRCPVLQYWVYCSDIWHACGGWVCKLCSGIQCLMIR